MEPRLSSPKPAVSKLEVVPPGSPPPAKGKQPVHRPLRGKDLLERQKLLLESQRGRPLASSCNYQLIQRNMALQQKLGQELDHLNAQRKRRLFQRQWDQQQYITKQLTERDDKAVGYPGPVKDLLLHKPVKKDGRPDSRSMLNSPSRSRMIDAAVAPGRGMRAMRHVDGCGVSDTDAHGAAATPGYLPKGILRSHLGAPSPTPAPVKRSFEVVYDLSKYLDRPMGDGGRQRSSSRHVTRGYQRMRPNVFPTQHHEVSRNRTSARLAEAQLGKLVSGLPAKLTHKIYGEANSHCRRHRSKMKSENQEVVRNCFQDKRWKNIETIPFSLTGSIMRQPNYLATYFPWE